MCSEDHASSTFLSESVQDLNNYLAAKEWGVVCTIRHARKETCKTIIFFFFFARNNAAKGEWYLRFFTDISLDYFEHPHSDLLLEDKVRDSPRRSSICPSEKVENALEAAITGLSRGTSVILMRFIPSYLQKPEPCCFPLQKEHGYRGRKVGFLLKSFKSQEDRSLFPGQAALFSSPLGGCRGTQATAMWQLIGREKFRYWA